MPSSERGIASAVIVYAVVDDALSPGFPLGVELEVFVRREDAERFIDAGVCGTLRQLAMEEVGVLARRGDFGVSGTGDAQLEAAKALDPTHGEVRSPLPTDRRH